MAKAKAKPKTTKAKKPIAASTTRAFEHGRSAAGAKYVREGFGLMPSDDLEWALGWPHAIALVEDSDDSDDALQAAIDHLEARSISSALATRLARLLMNGIYPDPSGKGVHLTYEGKDFAARGPLTAEEVRTTLTEKLKGHLQSHGDVLPLLLEALIGPTALADVLVDAMTTLDDKQLIAHAHPKADLANHLPFLLLRVEPADAKKLRERIARRLKSVDTSDVNYTSVVRALGFAVDPKTAPRAAETDAHDAMLLVVADDPDHVARAVATTYEEMEHTTNVFARYLFTGGDSILALYTKVSPKIRVAGSLAELAGGLARMANPKAHALLLELATSSKAKTAAAKCIVERGALLRPFLERAAKGKTPSAKTAAALLGKFV